MKHRKLSIKLTERQFILLNTYQLHILEEFGESKTKQQIVMELLLPLLQVTDNAVTMGGA